MPQNIFKSQVLLVLLIASTFSTANHQKIRHHHKHRHKQVIEFDSNELNEIREAFNDFRKSVQYKDKISEEAIPHHHLRHHEQNTLNDEEETMPAQSNSNAMLRHKRVHTTTRPTTTTNLPKSDNNYDELYDDDDNGQPNDDANVHSRRSSQTENLTNGETLTDYKNANLATREGVDRIFQHHLQNRRKDPKEFFYENFHRTKIEGLCRWPSKKAIEMPYHPSKSYSPRKYIIHQCSDDTSCCTSYQKTCVAKEFHDVTLWFKVIYPNRTENFESKIVQNHTECHCIDKPEYTTLPLQRPSVQSWAHLTPCRCPLDFVASTNHGSCECKCEKQNCKTRVDGEEKFSLNDRRYINNGIYGTIKCHIGNYSKAHGQCPNRNERMKRNSLHHIS